MKTTRNASTPRPEPRASAKDKPPAKPATQAKEVPGPTSPVASGGGSGGSALSSKPDKPTSTSPSTGTTSPGKPAVAAHPANGRADDEATATGRSSVAASPTALKDPPKAAAKGAAKSTTHAVPASGVDALHAIYERRAVREYTGVKPSRDLLKRLVDAAGQAPSAMDLQPWSFVVVQDAATLKRLSDHAKKLSLARMPSGSGLSLYRRELEDPKTDIFHGAGTLVAIVAKPGPWPGVEDCCLAGQNFMLAAHALGLGTCPIGYARDALNEPSFKRELGIPNDHAVAMAIVVGHKKDQPSPTMRHEARVLGWS